MVVNKDFIDRIPYSWWNGDINELQKLFKSAWGSFPKKDIEMLLADKNNAIFIDCEGYCDDDCVCPFLTCGCCPAFFDFDTYLDIEDDD